MNKDAQGRWKVGMSNIKLKMRGKALLISPEKVDLDKPQRILAEWAMRAGVDAVDALPDFRERLAQNPGSRLFYYPDAHFTAEGHALAAETLLPVLSRAVRGTF